MRSIYKGTSRRRAHLDGAALARRVNGEADYVVASCLQASVVVRHGARALVGARVCVPRRLGDLGMYHDWDYDGVWEYAHADICAV
ncbi:MAG: hypothetical protein ACXVCO_09630 [Ktedonobacterales bacterium]